MSASYRLKRFVMYLQIFLMAIVLLIELLLSTEKRELKGEIQSDGKYVVGAMIEVEDDDLENVEDIENIEVLENEELVQEEASLDNEEVVISRYSGDLTAYAADCPACYGTLGCLPSYNVYRNGVLTYPDKTYGNVRIVASSKNIPCGSIIKFESKQVQSDAIYAIVLDRGVYNYDIDLLVQSEAYAYQYVGRSKIQYDVLRYGW